MTRLPEAAWKRLVERETGLDYGAAMSRRRGSLLPAILDRHTIEHAASAESAATVASALAREVNHLRPLRRWPWFATVQSRVAAASAIELLRLAGWPCAPEATKTLTDALCRQDSHVSLVRHLYASAVTSAVEQLNAEVYLSTPVSSRTAATARLVDEWTPVIEEALEAVGHEVGIDLFLRAPGAPGHQPESLLKTVRSGFRHSVLHIVIGAQGGSTGIGREIDASIARRRPVIWLVPPRERAPNSIIASASEADLAIVPIAGISELAPAIDAQVRRNLAAIRDLLRTKDSVPVAIMNLQEYLIRRYMRIPPRELLGLLQTARLTPQRAALLLQDPFVLLNEASLSELDALSSVLGVDVLAVQQDIIRCAAGL